MHVKPLLADAFGAAPEMPSEADKTTEEDLTDASKALLYGEEEAATTPNASTSGGPKATVPQWWLAVVALGILFFAGVFGWWMAGQLSAPPTENEIESVE